MAKVYLGLGSNLGDRKKFLESALNSLREEPAISVLRVSSVVETTPEENLNQPKFLNAVCEIETTLSPLDLLDKLRKIENKLGRPRERQKNSPRNIDLDILIFDDLLLKGKTLTIPHPKLHQRYFVLHGLNELVPELVVPQHNKTVVQLLTELEKKP
jgi:2-amino-4-hydroxy-6-hydroxymethyldihydropteridine diphosphokinase